MLDTAFDSILPKEYADVHYVTPDFDEISKWIGDDITNGPYKWNFVEFSIVVVWQF